MGNYWKVGRGAAGVHFDAGSAPRSLSGRGATDDTKEGLNANKSAVAKLLKELDDAQSTGKNQTVQELRDKLNEKREALGDEEFKKVLEQLKEGPSNRWLELLKALFPDLFADTPSPSPSPASPSPSTSRGGGGGGGGGGRGGGVNQAGFGPRESMSDKPSIDGSKHFNYKPDNSDPGKKPDNIWSGFRQGDQGNCITVSAIKAAMMRYGQKPTDVYKEVKETSKGYEVTMRDGTTVPLTKDELKQAAAHAGFKGDDPAMITDANFMYAVSAKRAQLENNDGTAKQSFTAALNSLNDGEYAREGLDRLGLKGLYRQATMDDLRSSKVGTVEFGGHSMAVINGRMELWGGRGDYAWPGIATVLI